ncbi:hypothetical protein SFHH103_psfHH103d_548 (plasmid) [Sinorhizobium fredii HH103]|nr:hypothetical protein SFHH103_04595 [Sinorhizobium fredii HH103]CEO91755.1 hypothetical protein SFHH103_psfHH103d_548 [Sinorhizobium fredii HH103]
MGTSRQCVPPAEGEHAARLLHGTGWKAHGVSLPLIQTEEFERCAATDVLQFVRFWNRL